MIEVEVVDSEFLVNEEDIPLVVKQIKISLGNSEVILDPDEVFDLIRDLNDAVDESEGR